MNHGNNQFNGVISLVIIAVMILSGASVLAPVYFATHDKFVLIFALIWIGILGLVMVRMIMGIIKNKKNSLDDMQQYYDRQEEEAFQDATPVSSVPPAPQTKNAQYTVQIVKAIIMMVLGSFVLVPALMASHSLLIVPFALLWYGMLGRSIVQNVVKMKKAADDPMDDLQSIVQNSNVSSAVHLQRKMVICPYCGKESPDNFTNCCHCGRKLS